MRTLVLPLAFALSMGVANAQTQQAGADGGKAEEAFQELIAKCDNTDLLIKRGKVRLILGRIAEDKAAEAQAKIDEGFAKCGEGDLEAAGASMDEAFAIADAASTETFGTDSDAGKSDEVEEAPAVEADKAEDEADEKTEAEKKPWWKFW